ncbi:hypothetical protein NEIELOOT_01789, partial [Neisseria elongata subsp. glycolytica ATCC 29315]
MMYTVKTLFLHSVTVQDTVKSFEKLGNNENKEGRYRSTTAAT